MNEKLKTISSYAKMITEVLTPYIVGIFFGYLLASVHHINNQLDELIQINKENEAKYNETQTDSTSTDSTIFVK